MELPEYTLASARQWDARDPLREFRDRFIMPKVKETEVIYFTGNSLGLQAKDAGATLDSELKDWALLGVEGHFHARHPWFSYHERFTEGAATLVGARPAEVVMMNQLTSNLHFLLVSFYRPQGKRVKILTEQRPFPSDTYALASHIQFHGLDPKEHLIEVQPREGEHTLRTEDILAKIAELGNELALVCFSGVQYYTGQFFHIGAITAKAHEVGAIAGFDLAHAVGNVPLHLHGQGVDFACWCTYKYLNSGPGSVGGAFIHEKHLQADRPRFAGWWGHDKKTRFQMGPEFSPMHTAEGWQVSNAPVLNMAIHHLSLSQFMEAGMERLRAKSLLLTGYSEKLILQVGAKCGVHLEIITPADPAQRGCQLSVIAHGKGKMLYDRLTQEFVSVDWRAPNVIRLAPVPMYNSFEDVYRFAKALEKCLSGNQVE